MSENVSYGTGNMRAMKTTARCRGKGAPRYAADTEYRLLFELNPNPMWIFDEATLRFLAVNDAALKLYGWSREEFLRMTVKDVRPPEEVPRLLWALAQQRGSRVASAGEWCHWKRDHTHLDVEVTISCIQFQGRDARLSMITEITARKRAEEELHRAKALSEALNEISEALHATLDFSEVIQRLVSQGAGALGSDTAAVSLREDGGWRVSHIHRMPARYIGLRLEDRTERHALLALKLRQPVAVADAFHDTRFNRAHFRRHNIRAVLVAPLIARGKPIGVISFNYHGGLHNFTEAEVNFARQLASAASIALENARLFAERKRAEAALQESEQRLKADLDATMKLAEIGMLFAREGDLKPLLTTVVDAAIAISGADFGNIQLLDPVSGNLEIVAQRGFPKWWIEFWDSVSTGKGACGTALERGERVVVEDLEQSRIFVGTPGLKLQRKAGVRAVQSTPLVSRSGKSLGMFSTHYKRPHRPDERTLPLLDLLARLAADLIERTQAEGALHESEARYRNLFYNDLTGDFIAKPDGTILLCNPAFASIFGFASARAAVGSSLAALCSLEDPWSAVVKLLRHRKGLKRRERNARRCDGKPLHIVETMVGTFNRQGDLLQIQGYVFDDTERALAASALQRSEQRLALAASGTRIGLFEWNMRTSQTLWTEPCARLLGLTTTTTTMTTTTALSLNYTYRDWRRRVHRADRPRVEADLRRCMSEHRPYEADYRVVWPDKSVHWVAARGVFLEDEKGQAERMLGIMMDVTDRKRAETELKEFSSTLERRVAMRTEELTLANQRLQAVMDTALIGILTLDQGGVIESVNPAALRIFGCAPAEMLETNVNRLLASPNQPQHEVFLSHYLQTREKHTLRAPCEVLGRHKDGHAMILEFTLAEFPQPGRGRFVAMVRDITLRKRLERELLEVGERERQRLGHDLHDGLGQHLHALYYMASLLQKEMKTAAPEWAQEAGRLAQQLERGLELTRSLARGLQPVNAVPEGLMVALRELAERTRTLYRVDCRFQCRTAVLVQRHAAANHLYRIAQEAVNNAMKHGKPTKIRIELAEAGEGIILRVHDNGLGIRQLTTRSPGMGLGVMQFRADAIRGSLAVQRHSRGGTEIVCSVIRQALIQQHEE